MNPFSLENKTILVTGASSGIGKATAYICAKLGATVLCAGRNKDRLLEVHNELKIISNKQHEILAFDLINKDEIDKLVDEIPTIEGFVSNAGKVSTKLIKFSKEEDLLDIWTTNTVSHLLLFQKLFKKKKLGRSCSIVFTASAGGTVSFIPGNGLYGMSKAALNALTKYIAIEFSGKGIRCNNVCPGMIETPMTHNLKDISHEDTSEDKKKYLLKRYGRPEEVATTICFLLSDASSFITGQSIVIDGGYSINH